MLNGRVYGGHRIDAQNTNLFVTAKDEEPEFVEWGYGGMGSVKAGKQHGSTQWSRLQSDRAGVGAVGGGAQDDDDDDGGGMSWVKKRKEQRERERKEREEKEGKEIVEPSPVFEVENQPSDPPPPPSVEESQPTYTHIPAPKSPIDEIPISPLILNLDQKQAQAQPLSAVDENSPAAEATSATPSGEEKHHITTAVNVPAPTSHHHYYRISSYSGSMNTSHTQINSSINSPVDGDREMISSPLRLAPFESAIEGANEKVDEDSNVSESDSDSEGGNESEDSEDDDEAEDEDEAERIRKTALGAGVEKVSSRHKEVG